MYAHQENIHSHANGYSSIQAPRTPNASLVAPNGVYPNEPGMHPSSVNMDYGMNTMQDEMIVNPRKRASDEPSEMPRRRAVVAVNAQLLLSPLSQALA